MMNIYFRQTNKLMGIESGNVGIFNFAGFLNEKSQSRD